MPTPITYTDAEIAALPAMNFARLIKASDTGLCYYISEYQDGSQRKLLVVDKASSFAILAQLDLGDTTQVTPSATIVNIHDGSGNYATLLQSGNPLGGNTVVFLPAGSGVLALSSTLDGKINASALVGGMDRLAISDGIPDNADGENGMVCVDFNTGVLYEKSADVWSSVASATAQEVFLTTDTPSAGTGVNDDIAIVYVGGVIDRVEQKSGGAWGTIALSSRASRKNVLEVVDHFLGNGSAVTGSGNIGDLGWDVLSALSDGSAQAAPNSIYAAPSTKPLLGVIKLSTAASVDAGVSISMSNGNYSTAPFLIENFTRLTNFRMIWQFRLQVNGDYDTDSNADFYIGLTSSPDGGAGGVIVPTRFVGLKAEQGTANFYFEAVNGAPAAGTDTLVPVDQEWHTFELGYDTDTNQWLMKLDDEDEVVISKVLTDSLTVTIGAWIRSNEATSRSMYIDTFQLYGVYEP